MRTDFIMNAKKDVWEIYDVFRGQVKTEKVKNYYFSVKSLKYLSQNNDHPYRIPFDALWEKVTCNEVNIGERMDEAFQTIELLNPSLQGLWTINKFSAISDKTLFYIADSILNKYSFNSEDLDDSTPLTGTIAQYTENVLELMIQKEGAEAGAGSSPTDISELIVKLLNMNTGYIYDGTAGINDFLIESYKKALKNGSKVKLFGQENNKQNWSLGKINLILHGLYIEDAETKFGNTITNPLWKIDNNQLMKFDGIVSCPPFGLGEWGHKEALNDLYGRFRYGVPSRVSGDWAFVSHFIASLKGNGRAALIVPNGVLFRGAKEGVIRERIVKEDLVEAVIGLPSNLFYGTGIPATVLIINKSKEKELKDKIVMINAEEGFNKGRVKNTLRKVDIDKITSTYLNREIVDGYSTLVDISEIQQNDWSLYPFRYLNKIDVNTDIGRISVYKNRYDKVNRKKIKDISEIQRGINASKNEFDENNPSHFLINLVSVDNNGNIIPENLKGVIVNSKKAKDYELVPGDVLISSRGNNLKVMVIPNTDMPLVFSSNFARIRLHDIEKYNPLFIKYFLEGPIGQYYVKQFQTGSMITVLSTKDIAQIYIPNMPYEQQIEISEKISQIDKEYEDTIKIAETNRKKGYLKGYQLMGIDDTFEIL